MAYTLYDYVKMKSFLGTYKNLNWEEIKSSIYAKSREDAINALQKNKLDIEDFKALISPAASPFLEVMAEKSHRLTQQRFGKTIQMYLPLYLSNECQNICTYCGFSLDNKIKRKTLSNNEIIREAEIIAGMGYKHVLLVTGEANKTVGIDYLLNAVKIIKPYFENISIEVQPLEEKEYKQLSDMGIYSVLVYQETYNRIAYAEHHPKGRKSNFDYRLETPDRLGKACIHKIGLGTLIGLEDWRTESIFTALHLQYLEKKYWKTKYSISFPRLRPHVGDLKLKSVISDRELVQLIAAFRLLNQEVELSMSTRESANFRDNIIKLGVTSISAGSKTEPGGYNKPSEALEQFEICDERSPQEVAESILSQGYEPIWKDWDKSLQI